MKERLKKIYGSLGSPVLCAVLGFIGAACIVPFSGILTALPLLPLCGIGAGFLKLKRGTKTAFFAVCGGLLAAGYSADAAKIIIYAIVCGLTALLCDYCITLFKNRKTAFWAVIPLAASVALQLVFGGNIITYSNALKVSDEYVKKNYADSENEIIGGLEYDFITRTWRREVISKEYSDANGKLIVFDKTVSDSYAKKTEKLLMSEQRAKIANILRDAFPNGSFTVVSEKIYGYPDGSITYPDKSTDRTDKMVFAVYLGALTDSEGFLNTAAEYRQVLKNAGIDIGNVIFLGGGLGLYPMEEVYADMPFSSAKVKYNCGKVFERLQAGLDRHFIKDEFLYN